jgi:hypothetical protein
MSKYGTMARRHWQQHLPSQHQQIEDPEVFFTTLGEQIQTAVEQRTDLIAGEDPPGETFLDKLGRLNEAKLSAEGEVLREMLPEAEDDVEAPQTA